MRSLTRREFNGLCVTVGSFAIPTGAPALDDVAGAASTGAARTVKFRDGTVVPAMGQGSAGLGKGKHPQAVEEEAIRTGLSLGMTLIDTAEIYGSEEFIGRAIAGQRNRVFLVSKVWPSHEQHAMPVMAYSPLGGAGASLPRDPTLVRIAAAHGCSAAAVALAWTIRSGNVVAIPESGSVKHVKENAVALTLTLTPQELRSLNAAFPLSNR